DGIVNNHLRSWKLLTLEGKESDASIRSILSHPAGILDGEDGFYGLRIGDPEICLLDILEGKTKYNNRPVRAEKPQGTAFEYSDAGYCVLQQMIQDVTGKAFEDVVQELIFDKLELKNTFFATLKNIEMFNVRMVTGYDEEGKPIPGRFPLVPDLAASGLWSTPEDLLIIAAEFLNALNGNSTLLQKESALEMIKPLKNFSWTGLGIFLNGEDTLVSKGWGENGQCMMKIYIQKGEISVVMTNKNPGVDQSESGIEWLVDCYTYFI
ncbi:MAG: beta-lactamase family protein, partial [Lachnospiraceae bacterium]|nr:beta-lactamase family protein [Lachnospiraceae bacterium]